MVSQLLQQIRTIGAIFFHHFGLHCATHQIRIILVSCVVITSLFYPALDLYYSSSPSHLPYLSYLSYVPSLYPFTSRSDSHPTVPSPSKISDLHNIWVPHHPTLRIQEDAVSRARCRMEPSVRLERVLIQSSTMEDEDRDGSLNRKILLETFGIEKRLQKELSKKGLNCLQKEGGECLVISPLVFWDYDLFSLGSETAIIDTLSVSQDVSLSGVLVTPRMVLAGRGTLEGPGAAEYNDFDYAEYVVLTYFFPESDCLGNTEHIAWKEALETAIAQSADVSFQDAEPDFLSLQYEPSHRPLKGNSSIISTFTYLAYTFFFAYVTWSMKKMRRVHSRIGLTFTALVEIAVSTITSLSVCALVGFKVTMVPWELLPIVIVFVGAENMFNLVDAVTKTSTNLTVKERIAEGLARAGTSNTLKVVSYNSILGVIAVFSFGAIRQFCVFAIVVLVAHWFLAHTFFLAVLSIDIQRLGLDELLKQGTGLAPASAIPSGEHKAPAHKNRWQYLVSLVQNALRGRARTNLSLFLLLATTATLYYTTYPSSTPRVAPDRTPRQAKALARNRNDFPQPNLPSHTTPAYNLWHFLNPAEDPLLHLRVESPTIITLKQDLSDSSSEQGSPLKRPIPGENVRRGKSRLSSKSLFWLLNIVVLPISATTGALYGLLLYLLKDAELLEAQKHRAEANSPKAAVKDEQKTLGGQISFNTLPRGVEADIDLLAATKDGKLIACVSVQNEVVVWWKAGVSMAADETDTALHQEDKWLYTKIDTTDLLLRSKATLGSIGLRSQPSISSVAVNAEGSSLAVGTSAGVVGIWEMSWPLAGEPIDIHPLAHLTLSAHAGAVINMAFIPNSSSHTTNNSPPWLLVMYDDAQVVEWRIGSSPQPNHVKPKGEGSLLKSMYTHVYPDDRILVIFGMDHGGVELTEVGTSYPLIPSHVVLRAGDSSDLVTVVHACRLELGGSSRLIIGAATAAGSISLWDGSSGTCISAFDDVYGCVNNLRISPVAPERCEFCSEVCPESFSVTFSVGQIVQFYKICLPADANHRCSCPRPQSRHISSWDNAHLGRRSRSSSISSSAGNIVGLTSGLKSNGGSPLSSRARLATAYDTAPFPVSGHGIHSRRGSEKDSSRRMSDILTVPIPFEDLDNKGAVDGSTLCTTPPAFSWQGATVVRAFADLICERGGWDVLDGKITGVRRRVRLSKANGSATSHLRISPTPVGLSSATLERWEVWVLDPSRSHLRCSPLVELAASTKQSEPPPDRRQTPRLPFTRVSPFISIRSYGLAGFGNTLGMLNFSSLHS